MSDGSRRDPGFLQLSASFDRLMRRVNGDLSYRLLEDAPPVAEGASGPTDRRLVAQQSAGMRI